MPFLKEKIKEDISYDEKDRIKEKKFILNGKLMPPPRFRVQPIGRR